MSEKGSLACVGIGMTLGAHIGARARATIERADVVFMAVSDPLVELWLQGMHHDVRSLQPCYGGGRTRLEAYAEMVSLMLAEVRAGKRVCGAFYGHPGVFAVAPHQAIAAARAAGYPAHMEPGVSAEDCLYADLGLDPGTSGCQQFEAGQFVRYRRDVDRAALLILWQVGMAVSGPEGRQLQMGAWQRLLLQCLLRDYPGDHRVTLYEAATLATARPRMETLPLSGIGEAVLFPQTTLVVPASRTLQPDQAILEMIAAAEPAAPPSSTIHTTV
jgi:siroheme synthase